MSLLSLYKKGKETDTIVPKMKASAQNLIIQRLIFNEQPSEHNVVGKEKTSARAENTKCGHTFVDILRYYPQGWSRYQSRLFSHA